MKEELLKKKAVTSILFLSMALTAFLVVKMAEEIKKYSLLGTDIHPVATIYVSGEGEAFAVPDIGQFSFSVQKESELVSDAQEYVTDTMNSAIEFLKDSGLDKKDIKTTSYNVYPRYEYQPEPRCLGINCPRANRVLVGYEVSQTVSVKVRDTSDVGKLLGGIGEIGVSNVSGLTFSIEDEDIIKREARQEAIDDAQEKAKALAKDLGVKLVRVISFSESGGGVYPMYYETKALGMGGDAMGAPVPDIPTGENKITSNVTITYEIR